MKSLTFLTASLLIGLACSAPSKTSDSDSVSKEMMSDEYVIYRSEYDIATILFPLGLVPIKDKNDNNQEGPTPPPLIFFALADYKDGHKEDKGFYIRMNGEVTKLLDHGRDAASTLDGKGEVYIAAEDGLYSYNFPKNKAEKFGTVTDNLIGIAKVNASDTLYILTNDHIVYKVTEKGTKKDKVSEIVNADQIAMDHESNLFYVANNKVNVFNSKGAKEIAGLPETSRPIKLIRPPIMLQSGMPVYINDNFYLAFGNGTSTTTQFKTKAPATAYALDGGVVLYIGVDKKIYEYNLIAMLFDSVFQKIRQNIQESIEGFKKNFMI